MQGKEKLGNFIRLLNAVAQPTLKGIHLIKNKSSIAYSFLNNIHKMPGTVIYTEPKAI